MNTSQVTFVLIFFFHPVPQHTVYRYMGVTSNGIKIGWGFYYPVSGNKPISLDSSQLAPLTPSPNISSLNLGAPCWVITLLTCPLPSLPVLSSIDVDADILDISLALCQLQRLGKTDTPRTITQQYETV